MKSFNKIVRIGQIDIRTSGIGPLIDIFCKISISADGCLSISGVEGPKHNGDAYGSCGQIDMHLRERQADIIPAIGWDADKLSRFFEVWEKWHLNDMRAGCEHQTGPDWDVSRKLTLYYFRTNDAVRRSREEWNQGCEQALRAGKSITPTEEETRLALLPHEITLDTPNLPESMRYDYEPNTPRYDKDSYNKPSEEKTAGWVRPDEHPLGILTKACPVCGYKYGSQWRKAELPQDVIAFLQSLPETDKAPAWV